MAIKIMIERKFKEPLCRENFQAIDGLRMGAMQQKGYVTGETLVNTGNNREVLVLSTWSSIEGWQVWSKSKEREELDSKLGPYLSEPTKIRAFVLGADAITEAFEKFFHDMDTESQKKT